MVIVKEVSGQGAVYDTRLFGNEPCGYEGGRSVIDMGWMPVVVTPNEFGTASCALWIRQKGISGGKERRLWV